MSCLIANLQGGDPEIFPVAIDLMRTLEAGGLRAMAAMIDMKSLATPAPHYVGTALKPDGKPFYLTTLAPDLAPSLVTRWEGAFFAPFGVGEVVGSVVGDPGSPPAVTLSVKAKLVIDGRDHVSVEWDVVGSQNTMPNKAALIRDIRIVDPGPHDPADLRRCIALHGPQRIFGEPRAIVAMQCGVAAACLIEAIC